MREQGLEVVTATDHLRQLPRRELHRRTDALRPAPATSCSWRAAATTTASRWTSPCAAFGGEDSEKAQGWCNFCTGPQMVTAAENVARPLLVHLAARPDPRRGRGRRPRHHLIRADGEGKSGRRSARVLLGAGVAAIGAAAIVDGQRQVERAVRMPNASITTAAGMKVSDCLRDLRQARTSASGWSSAAPSSPAWAHI